MHDACACCIALTGWCCRWLHHADPVAAAVAVHEKFGSLRSTIVVFICALLAGYGSLTLVAAFSGWSPAFLVPSYIAMTCLGCLLLGDLLTPCAPPKDRAPLIGQAYGKRAMLAYIVSVMVFYVAAPTWQVIGFINPPFGQELAMAGALVIINGAAQVALAGIAIPLSSPGAHTKRISMLLTLCGSWLEVATDCASGITAVRDGQKVFGGIILASGELC